MGFFVIKVSPRVELVESSGKPAKTSLRSLSRCGARRTRLSISTYYQYLKREYLNLVGTTNNKKLIARWAFLLLRCLLYSIIAENV